MGELYTVGHSNYTMDEFFQILRMNQIQYILDVRSMPYCKYAEHFNREPLRYSLEARGIHYAFMGKYFGARQTDPSLYSPGGYLDFERVRETPGFQKGVANVLLGMEQGNRIALMCSEKDPIDCHRAILVARGFELKGVAVRHIMPGGAWIGQDALNERLLEMYAQSTLFAPLDEEDDLIRAYRLRNRDIGYRQSGAEAARPPAGRPGTPAAPDSGG